MKNLFEQPLSTKSLLLIMAAALSLQFLMGASSTSELEREVERLRSELATSNRHLEQISRSLDRMDDAFGSSALKVQNVK